MSLINNTQRKPEEWIEQSPGNAVESQLGSLLTGTLTITNND